MRPTPNCPWPDVGRPDTTSLPDPGVEKLPTRARQALSLSVVSMQSDNPCLTVDYKWFFRPCPDHANQLLRNGFAGHLARAVTGTWPVQQSIHLLDSVSGASYKNAKLQVGGIVCTEIRNSLPLTCRRYKPRNTAASSGPHDRSREHRTRQCQDSHPRL